MSNLKKVKYLLSKKKKIAYNRAYGNNSKSWKCEKCLQVFCYNHHLNHDCENYKYKKYKNLINNKGTRSNE